jgi:hypothetical protein
MYTKQKDKIKSVSTPIRLYGLYGIPGLRGSFYNRYSYQNSYLRPFDHGLVHNPLMRTITEMDENHYSDVESDTENVNIVKPIQIDKIKIECKSVETQTDDNYTRSIGTQCTMEEYEYIIIKENGT